MIRLLALDIDGVLTDGRVFLDAAGRETKALHFWDIDAVYRAHRQGLAVVLVTGEDTEIVEAIARKLSVTRVYRQARDKAAVLRQVARDTGVPLEEMAFVGDAPKDAAGLAIVGLGLAPADAHETARAAARRVLSRGGGAGAVAEAVDLILGKDGEKGKPG